MAKKFTSVDEYIANFSGVTQAYLKELRAHILKKYPSLTEEISYNMPAYKLNGKIVCYYAGYQHHIGMYALPNTHKHFASELKGYKQGKGSIQFPLDKPLPFDVIDKLIDYSIQSRLENSKSKKD